jgi:hypothetical protein
MAESSVDGLIDAVAPGDIVALDRDGVERAYKVVHKEEADSGYLITFEGDDGETFQLQLAAGVPVKRSLESKWESAQSPTPHSP